MSVNPGWGGQSFIAGSLAKVEAMSALGARGRDRGRRRHRPHDRARRRRCRHRLFVAGSAIFGKPDPGAAYREIATAVAAA